VNLANISLVLLGGALVGLGVIAGALADRIRNVRRSAAPREPRQPARHTDNAVVVSATALHLRTAVIKTLMTSGYARSEASAAVDACQPSERSTIESWTRAALRNAIKSA